ncbi:ABC transporter permease [Actinokineospora guangxiensis]|uniref:Transport permease protein n=1 Tax=Actinokineospora guangxiensis TaxID=1490288 RepID=A0ABW0EVN2_9PSEU
MTALITPPSAGSTARRHVPLPSRTAVFLAILRRDFVATWREMGSFLAQVVIQPVLLLFIFGKVLGDIGYTGSGFGDVLLPGLVAMNAFLGALQNTALPLVMDFSFSREIEDRLLSPLPTSLVALEKIVFGTLRGIVAAAVIVPIGLLILPGVAWPASAWLPALGVTVIGAYLGAAIGMTVGTVVSARRITVMFTVVLTPLMFTGATQFPWPALDGMRWFQIVCAANPLTYLSEAMRAVVVPSVPHIPLLICLAVMTAAAALFTAVGVAGFRRRAQD